MRETCKNKRFSILVIFYTLVMGIYEMADYFYGVSYMVTLNKHLAVESIAILIGIHEIGLLVFDFPSGVVSDFFGRKKTASISIILYGIGLIALAFSSSFGILILVFLLLAFATAMFSGSPQAWFYDILIKENRLKDRERLLPRMSGAVKLMSSVSSLLAIVLMYIDVTSPLIVGGIIGIIVGLFFLFFFEDNKGNSENKKFFEVFKDFSKSFFLDKRMRGMIAFEIFDYAAFSLFIFTWQLYLLNQFNIKETEISIIFVCFTLCMAAGSFLTSFLLKHLSGFKISIIGKVGIVLSFVGIVLTTNIWILLAEYILFEIFFSISSISVGIWRNDYISSKNRATFYSGISSVKSMLFIVITPCLGIVINCFGYISAWILAAVIESISLVFIIRFIKKFGGQKEESDA